MTAAQTAEATEPTCCWRDVPCQAQSCSPQESLVPTLGQFVPIFLAHPNSCRSILVINFSLFPVTQDVMGHSQPLKLYLSLFFVVGVFIWVDYPSQTPVFAVDFVLWGVLWQVHDSVKILSFHWKSATPSLIFQHLFQVDWVRLLIMNWWFFFSFFFDSNSFLSIFHLCSLCCLVSESIFRRSKSLGLFVSPALNYHLIWFLNELLKWFLEFCDVPFGGKRYFIGYLLFIPSRCNFNVFLFTLLQQSCFLDICKAFVISYKNLGLATTVDRNDYRFSRPYRSLAQECNSSRSKTNLKGLRDLMYTRFAIKENIPCRVAYDKACYRYLSYFPAKIHIDSFA